MRKILDEINDANDLRNMKLNITEQEQLASEMRQFILENVSKTGGHLASSLGAIELTIAIHNIFDTPKDKIIWDVGHQTYPHKILTGRKNNFNTLRKLNGIAGFPKTSESIYDTFNTGHSSTSISAALGMARARDIRNENYRVVAVIGDGALTGGMALEALNDAGASGTNIIVILNDNGMSISKNTGGLARALTKMRTRKFYTNSNKAIKRMVLRVPKLGKYFVKSVRRMKHKIKQLVLPNMLFEDIGFKYLGPVDGNDIEKIEELLKRSKDLSGPILIHCKTIKGKGYKIAENNPDKYHSVSSFNIETGKPIKEKHSDYSAVFGNKLVEIAKENSNIVAITAAMTAGTGLTKFKNTFPNRFFDVEIAEQHAMTLAAGMAMGGLIPVISLYSSFLQRAYDQLIHDVCMQNLHVVICIDRAGIVGSDGETHQGLLDMAFLGLVPNITILAPKDYRELEDMLEFAINEMNSPVAIRYPRGEESDIKFNKDSNQLQRLYNGFSEIITEGNDISIIGIGKMVSRGIEVANILKEKYGLQCEVINASFFKPLDEKNIRESIKKTKNVITIEDGTIIDGLYSKIEELIIKENLSNIKIKGFGYPDKYIQHGSVDELEKINLLDAENIAKEVENLIHIH